MAIATRDHLTDALASAAWARRQAQRRGDPTSSIDRHLDTLLDQWLAAVRGQ